MKVLVIGATGGVGRQIVRDALADGHRVTAFVRSPDKLGVEDQQLTVVQGDVLDAEAVDRVVRGQDAVLSALGGASSASKVRSEGTVNVVAAMKRHGVRRIAVVSAIGVGDSLDQARRSSFVFGRIILPMMLRKTFADMARMEELLRDSQLDWSIVRPTGLTDDPAADRIVASGNDVKVGSRIPRADVARFMVGSVADTAYVRRTVSLHAGV